MDDLIGGIIDSMVNVANTNLNFGLPSKNTKELAAWKTWSRLVNIDLKSVLPGAPILNEQLMLSMLKTGMAVPDFEWGKLRVGQREYEFPTKITIYPSLGVKLQSSDKFGEEDVLIGLSEEYKDTQRDNATDDVPYTVQYTEHDGTKKTALKRKNAYAIKYKYDNQRPTLYPNPILKRSFESIALRHKMIDADISLLEMIINKIIQIKVGDKDHDPLPSRTNEDGSISDGDIELAQDLFEDMDSDVEVIVTPYFYEIKVILPDTMFLLDQKKYAQSTYNIMSNFGILLDPNASSNIAQFEKINLKNFEKFATTLQAYISAWYTWVAMQIVKRNGGKLKTLPVITFDKPDIYDPGFLDSLTNLVDKGYMDIFTLQDKFGLDPESIKENLLRQKEVEDKYEGIYEPRPTFKQEVVTGNETKTTSTSNGGGETDKSKKLTGDDKDE